MSPLHLFAAGSLRLAFTPMLARFTERTGINVAVQYGPAGELASAWILRQGFADVFIGYAHYAKALSGKTDIRCITLADDHNILCEYQLAVLDSTPEVNMLVSFILSPEGQAFLTAAGFLTVTSQS